MSSLSFNFAPLPLSRTRKGIDFRANAPLAGGRAKTSSSEDDNRICPLGARSRLTTRSSEWLTAVSFLLDPTSILAMSRPLSLSPSSDLHAFRVPSPKSMHTDKQNSLSKVPEVTLLFWIIKILATTLGETGGDAVTMSMHLGYLVGTGIFAALFLAAVLAQVSVRKFHPFLYWATIIATTTVGTTLADFADRSLGIGYAGGSLILSALVMPSLFLWHRTLGSLAVDTVSSPKAEGFYWVTIMFSQTLGTALGDWTADTADLGYTGAAMVFGAMLALVAAAWYWTEISRTALFWAAFILTRPLGAVVGDFLDKPRDHGGLALSRYSASAALISLVVLMIVVVPQRPARRAH